MVVETYTEQEEAQFVVSEIERLVEQGEHSLGECAVMYRTNAQSRVLEEAFVRYGMPYKLVAGTRFYERREVKDIIAYLRLIQNPHDSVSLMRVINVPQRGIGQQTQLKLAAWSKSMGVSQFKALQCMNGESTDDLKSPFNSHISRVLKAFSELMEELISRSKEMKMTELFDLVVERSGYKEYILNEGNGEADVVSGELSYAGSEVTITDSVDTWGDIAAGDAAAGAGGFVFTINDSLTQHLELALTDEDGKTWTFHIRQGLKFHNGDPLTESCYDGPSRTENVGMCLDPSA